MRRESAPATHHSDDAGLHALAVAALEPALAGEDAEKSLARVLRAHPLSNAERAVLARRVLGASCLRATLRFWLQDPNAGAAALIDAYARFVEGGAPPEVPWPGDPQARLCVEASLPAWIATLWIDELGFESARSLARAMNTPGPTTLRTNSARIDREALLARLKTEGIEVEEGRLAPHALRVVGRANLWGSASWREGLFEVQDEGSQLIVEACGVQKGERWLDLCAGAGGKSLALAAAGAKVLACDVNAQRLDNLRARKARAQADSIEIRQLQPGNEAAGLGNARFDGVLVDAPCSELGVLRRHPDSRWRIEPGALDALPGLQARLLELAKARADRWVYATCTVRRAENEGVAGPGRLLRPDVEGTDGFFIARAE